MMTSSVRTALLVAGLAAGVALAADWWPFGKEHEKSTVPVQVDMTPLQAEVKAATSVSEMLKATTPAVVRIQSARIRRPQLPEGMDDPRLPWFFRQLPEQPQREFRQQGEGSGVIVTADGYVLTNNHVVENADEIVVVVGMPEKEYEAEIVGTDPRTDLAVLKIEGEKLPTITVGDSDLPEVGDRVYAIGNPFGVGKTVTSGIVSATQRRGLRITDYENFIQTDASINPGNSGGALVDAQGRLIGINTAIFSRSGGNQGIGFAIPSNLARRVMEQLLRDGRVSRGYLGVRIQPMDETLREEFGVAGEGGALVANVGPETPAGKAGIKSGDVILKVGEQQIADVNDLRLKVAQILPGTKVPVELARDGERKKVTVELAEFPEDDEVAAGGGWSERGAARAGKGLLTGVMLMPLSGEARRQTELPEELEGVLVTRVEPESAAARAGLTEGDVITEIERRQVESPAAAAKAARAGSGKRLLVRVWRDGGAQFLVIRG